MAQTTPNLGLKKPELTDYIDQTILDLAANFDTIDNLPSQIQTQIINSGQVVTSINSKTGSSITLSASDVGAETPAGAQTKVDTHAVLKQTHGISGSYYIAKTSRSDQLPDWSDIQNRPSSAVANIDDAVNKRHSQNTDNTLTSSTANTINTTGTGNIVDFKVSGVTKSSIDNSGNFTGTAAQATKLATARNISLSGDVSGSTSFNGTADVTIVATLANSGVTAGTYTKVTVDAKGRVTSGTTLSESDVPNISWSKITSKPTTLAGYGITDAVNISDVVTVATANKILKLNSESKLPADITGNAATADKLKTARIISLTGDVTGSASFDGSANASISATLASVTTAGTYTKVTVDAKGRVTSGTALSASDIPNLDWSKITSGKPTTLAGYGITDAIANAGSTPSIQAGLDSAKPTAGTTGRIYIATDTKKIYRDNGSSWDMIGGTDTIDWNNITNKPSTFTPSTHTHAGTDITSTVSSATTATKLATARTISLSGDVTGSASFDGSANASITATLTNSGVTAGTYTKVTVDAKGRVTSGTTLSASDIPNLDWSKITSGKPTTLAGYGITDAVNIAGSTMTGDLSFSISATNAATKGIVWFGLTDDHRIFVEEYGGSESTRLVIQNKDNGDTDYTVIRNIDTTGTTVDALEVHRTYIKTPVQIRSTVSTGTAPFTVSSTTVVSNLNADMVDGYHASSFASSSHNHDSTYVKKSGDIITGNLYINNHGFGGSPVIALAIGDTDTGLHSDTDGRLEFWTNNGERAYLTSSEFNSYVALKQNGYQVWHAGNDGSGSGLDADKVDGHHIFVQSSTPTAGAVGDLWIW